MCYQKLGNQLSLDRNFLGKCGNKVFNNTNNYANLKIDIGS